METTFRTGNPSLLARAAQEGTLSSGLDAFLSSLDLAEDERAAVHASLPDLERALREGARAPLVVYGTSWF